jgi:hypothetical protein
MRAGGDEHHVFQPGERPHFEPEVTAADCEGRAIGMKEFLWRRGWWLDGMTRQGFREPGAARGESASAATRWKVGDLVLRLEEDDRGEDMFVLYKVTAVPRGHKDVASQDLISCQMFKSSEDGPGAPLHILTDMFWHDFISDQLTSIEIKEVEIVQGSINGRTLSEKGGLRVRFDPATYYAQRAKEGQIAPDAEILEASVKIHPNSMEGVMTRLPEFQIPVKSLLQELLEANGHLLLLSPKYHAELAGVGIEYCFGRVKWWFRNKNTMSTESLKSKSLQSFGSDVVTVYHVRKFARRARDYMRAYSWGHTGLEVETAVKKYKTHRSALDTDFKFVSE